MKEIIISADGDSLVYLVPDDVADNLEKYCDTFCFEWLRKSPHAKKYRVGGVYCYDGTDFIDYLNEHMFPEEKSILVKNLGWTELGEELPEEYRKHPYYNF